MSEQEVTSADVQDLKDEVSRVRQSVTELTQAIHGLVNDINGLRQDISGLREAVNKTGKQKSESSASDQPRCAKCHGSGRTRHAGGYFGDCPSCGGKGF